MPKHRISRNTHTSGRTRRRFASGYTWSGFAWIELLVLGGMAAVMAAVLVPVLYSARSCQPTPTCVTNLQQIGVSIRLYANDHHGGFPPSLSTAGSSRKLDAAQVLPVSRFEVRLEDGKSGHYPTWMDVMTDYTKAIDPLLCDMAESSPYPSYGYSVALGGYGEARHLFGKDEKQFQPARYDEIENPGRVIMLSDFNDPESYRMTPAALQHSASSWSRSATPHGGSGYVIYTDGHVERHKRDVWVALPTGNDACDLKKPDPNSQYCEKTFNPFLPRNE